MADTYLEAVYARVCYVLIFIPAGLGVTEGAI